MRAARRLGIPLQLYAVNHCQVAITSHQLNHPRARHVFADIEGISPTQVVAGGRLRLLVASPSCTYHSNARGGKPINDQRRSSASYVTQWARELAPEDVLVENVPEFEGWGPLYPADHSDKKLQLRPIPERRGEHFRAFVADLQALGYRTEWRVLNAADYGDATSRRRFFLRASRGEIRWPAPTHSREQWRAAREIIDFDVPGTSIYNRKPALVPATMRRILAGVSKFSGLEPYLVVLRNHADVQSLEETMPTICAEGQHLGIAQPCLTKLHGGHDACSIDETLGTVTANFQHYGLVQPYLINLKGQSTASDIDAPMPTMTAHAQHLGVCQPYLTKYYGTGTGQSLDDTLGTVTTHDRFALTQPRLLDMAAGSDYLRRALQHPDPLYRPLIVEIEGVRYLVDILYRMLMPRELAAAMGFPADYLFTGSQAEQVRQIGNAVPVGLAEALCYSILEGDVCLSN